MSFIKMSTTAAPSTPATGKVEYFTKTDKRLYYIDDTGASGRVGGPPGGWYDVTDYGLKGDDSTDNLSAWNVLYALLPVNATVYFPPGTYRFSNELTLSSNLQARILGAGRSRSLLKITHATANLFNISNAAFYYTFEELGFRSSVTRTGGAYINAPSNDAYMDVRFCEFQAYFKAISLTGAIAGNVSLFEDCHFNSPAVNGTAITINGSNINMMISDCTIDSGTVAGSVGVLINQSGAVQFDACDFIGGVNALLVNATATVSALYFTNCFFDQSTLGSTVKFMGTAAISRVKFVCCGITCGTVGGSGITACEIAGTGTGTSIPEAIDFIGCDFYNNGGSGTTTGILVTGCRSFSVRDSRIAGFTNGIDVTPYNSNGITSVDIQENVIGATENFAANGTGVVLRAGAVQYGSVMVAGNRFNANTTIQINDLSTVSATTGQKLIQDNIGLPAGTVSINRQAIPIATTYMGGLVLPANSLRVNNHFRMTLNFTNPATAATTTILVKYGTAATTGDATIHTAGAFTGTANADVAQLVIDVHVETINASTGTITCTSRLVRNLGGTITGFANTAATNATPMAATQTTTLNTTTAANILGIAITGAVAATTVLTSATIETIA